jgi:phosphoribosylanthranilate isomerase
VGTLIGVDDLADRLAVISGGLNAGNIGGCVCLLHLDSVDVRSRAESQGRKNAAKLQAFMQAVRRVDATT